MEYYIGQKFEETYPPEAAIWCNENKAVIVPLDEGGFEIKAVPAPSAEMLLKSYENAVQNHLDATAQSRGYDNTYTCLSYLNSTDEKWKRESNAFNAWRDSVWRKAHEILNAFKAGEIEQPTIDEVISQLPEIDWNDPE